MFVPTEFVNVNLPYYFDKNQDYPVIWQQKRGKLNSLTYFAEIPERFLDTTVVVYSNHRNCADSIQNMVPVFTSYTEKSHVCPPESNTYTNYFTFGLEAGFRKTGYVGFFGLFQAQAFTVSAFLGMDYLLQVQSTISVDLVFWSRAALKSTSYLGRNVQDVHHYHSMFWLYGGLGTAYMSSTRIASWETIPNVHFGFTFKQPYMPNSFERIFIEGGMSYGFTPSTTKVEPYFRAGIRFKI